MIAYKIFRIHDKGYVVPADEVRTLLAEFEEMDLNDIFMVKKIEITQEELDKLPEFQGW